MHDSLKKKFRLGIKFCCALLGICFFIPSFMVSCSGQTVNISAAQSVVGYYNDDVQHSLIQEGAPWCILLLVLPLIICILWCVINLIKNKLIFYTSAFGCTILDFILWLIFKSQVFSIVYSKWLLTPQIKFGFIGSIILLPIILILTGLHLIPNADNKHENQNS